MDFVAHFDVTSFAFVVINRCASVSLFIDGPLVFRARRVGSSNRAQQL
jgi:hypothetical protein